MDLRKAIVIGTSAGGIEALTFLLPKIQKTCHASIFIVQHIGRESDSYFTQMLNRICKIKIIEACNNDDIKPGTVYFAPPDYHLSVEEDFTLSLSVDDKVNYSRPSIDVLFETAAEVFQTNLTGIILTGANSDGSQGLLTVKKYGGFTIVQNPDDALFSSMPQAALKKVTPNLVLSLTEIGKYLEKV